MLLLQDISFNRDNKQILSHVNLCIDTGKFVAITGPNGSGKSTLAKIIMGMEKPDSGAILFDGQDITSMDITQRAKLGIGFAFQQPVKFKGLTVQDLIELATGNKIKFSEACDYLSDVGLCAKEYIHREINDSLSGGELKRIEIASVMAKDPSVSIFDEPEAGIDLWSFRSLIDVFKQMESYAKGITIVISHQERILAIADQIIWMDQGKVKQVGSKNAMMHQILTSEKACPKGVMTCE